jgi:hypothetical protein
MAHTVLAFHSEVHQDGARENPCGRGVAMFRAAEEQGQQSCTWRILTMPTGLLSPPDEQVHTPASLLLSGSTGELE